MNNTPYQEAQSALNKGNLDRCLELCYANISSVKVDLWLCVIISLCLDALSIWLSITFANTNDPSVAFAFVGAVAVAFAVAGIFAIAGAVAVAVAFAVAGTFAFAVALAGTFAFAVALAGTFAGTFAVAGTGAVAVAGVVTGVVAVAVEEILKKALCKRALRQWRKQR